tara:strand:+ start:515 stop:1885 length:1371 start_codon:yes stop_codon:yes gene_type:complete
MAKKSKKYNIDGEQYVFNFNDAGNLVGISKPSGRNGQYKENAVDPNSDEFASVAASEEATSAYNVANYGGNKNAYQDSATQATATQQNQSYDNKTKKNNNQDIDLPLNQTNNIATNREENYGIGNPFTGYNNAKKGRKVYAEVFAYPLDIDPEQDHLKIKKYKYQRTSVQAGRPATTQTTKGEPIRQGQGGIKGYKDDVTTNSAGDSVLGMEQLGSVILPMPKVVDTNGAEWGESKINVLGLAAMGTFSKLGQLGVSKEEQERLKGLNKELKGKGRTSSFKDVLGALGGASFSQAASTAVGQQISTNEFLARASGRVLNPNAELLFQGPVLRDFNFDFLMIARSREEGDEIRRIIRWFKTGMAPRFNNSTYLETPDVFSLEYKRGQGPMDQLDTVNRFNPGGLALRTIAVDYAPNGYWSAYQDSQPVAVRMSLNFAELRPIFASDQEMTPASSVGY